MAHYSSGEAGWFSARTLSFNQCSQPVVVCEFGLSIPYPPWQVFSWHSSFLLHLKIRILSYFWSILLVSHCVYKACLAASGLITYVCAVAVTQRCLENPVGWKSRVTKTANYYYYFMVPVSMVPIPMDLYQYSYPWSRPIPVPVPTTLLHHAGPIPIFMVFYPCSYQNPWSHTVPIIRTHTTSLLSVEWVTEGGWGKMEVFITKSISRW